MPNMPIMPAPARNAGDILGEGITRGAQLYMQGQQFQQELALKQEEQKRLREQSQREGINSTLAVLASIGKDNPDMAKKLLSDGGMGDYLRQQGFPGDLSQAFSGSSSYSAALFDTYHTFFDTPAGKSQIVTDEKTKVVDKAATMSHIMNYIHQAHPDLPHKDVTSLTEFFRKTVDDIDDTRKEIQRSTSEQTSQSIGEQNLIKAKRENSPEAMQAEADRQTVLKAEAAAAPTIQVGKAAQGQDEKRRQVLRDKLVNKTATPQETDEYNRLVAEGKFALQPSELEGEKRKAITSIQVDYVKDMSAQAAKLSAQAQDPSKATEPWAVTIANTMATASGYMLMGNRDEAQKELAALKAIIQTKYSQIPAASEAYDAAVRELRSKF